MSEFEIVLRLVAVMSLFGVLFVLRRRRARRFQPLPLEKVWDGQPIDATRLTPRLRRLRRNFLVDRQSRHCPSSRPHRISMARRGIRSMRYFRRRPRDDRDRGDTL